MLVKKHHDSLCGDKELFIKFLICGNRGAVLYQCVAELLRFPQAR